MNNDGEEVDPVYDERLTSSFCFFVRAPMYA